MKTIPAQVVERTWKNASVMSQQQMQQVIDGMSNQQPFILAYLLAAGNDLFNQDERELLLYLGIVVWLMMSDARKPLTRVSEELLDEIEKTNMKMLEYLEAEPGSDLAHTIELIYHNYNQPEVLKYVVEALMEEPVAEDDSAITEDNLGMMLIYLKIVIDCFDKVG